MIPASPGCAAHSCGPLRLLSLSGTAPTAPRIESELTVSAACDFFTVPTLTFKLLYVFVVLSHDRRRILHLLSILVPLVNDEHYRYRWSVHSSSP